MLSPKCGASVSVIRWEIASNQVDQALHRGKQSKVSTSECILLNIAVIMIKQQDVHEACYTIAGTIIDQVHACRSEIKYSKFSRWTDKQPNVVYDCCWSNFARMFVIAYNAR